MTSLIDFVPAIVTTVLTIATIVLPFVLWSAYRDQRVAYKRQLYWNSKTPVLMEITLPKEIEKTPSAMELVLLNLHQTGGDEDGKTRPWFSLEVVSDAGKVRFFIWTWSEWKRLIETQIYAQYPGVEIVDVPDYTQELNFNEDLNMWGSNIILSKKDPYPIKTYRDYGIGDDASIDEGVKVDPITPMIEYLGAIGQKQKVWVQFLVRAHKDEGEIPLWDRWSSFWKKLGEEGFDKALKELSKTKDDWKAEAEEEIEAIKKKATPKPDKDGATTNVSPQFTKMQSEIIGALERSVSKLGYDVGIRVLYIGDKDFYDETNIGGLTSIFKQYSSPGLNGLKPVKSKFSGIELIEAYKARGYFYEPYAEKPMVLNSEELATVYHFPGQVVQTPSFERIGSKKAEAPSNLPI